MVALRTAHLVGVTGIGAGLLGNAPPQTSAPYLYLTLASGAAMLAVEIWGNGVYLLQVRGLAMMAKLALLAGGLVFPAWLWPAVIGAVVISGLSCHAPARVRHYSPLHGRVIDAL